MSVAVSTTVRRWLVPSAAALAVIAGGVAIGLVTNATDSARPPRTAQDLLVGLQTARVDGLQGTVTLRADLGLPPLPVPSLGSANLGSLVSGTHTLRVWYADPGQARIALLGRDGETDIIVNGEEVWLWSSKENSAVRGTLPTGGLADLLSGGLLSGGLLGAGPLGAGPLGGPPTGADGPGRPGGDALPDAPLPSGAQGAGGLLSGLDPESVAQLVLTLLQHFETDVTTDNTASVAGRDAYELTIAPRDNRSLVASIVLSIDAETNLPLRLAVLARDGGAPAFEVAFTELSLTRPDPAQFEFNPPPGTEVTEVDELPALPGALPLPGVMPSEVMPSLDGEPFGSPRFALIGQGWTTVLAVRVPEHGGGDAEHSTSLSDMLSLLPPVSGEWGSGRLLTTRLFSVLLTDDGRLLAGAVGPAVLYEAAADPAAQLES